MTKKRRSKKWERKKELWKLINLRRLFSLTNLSSTDHLTRRLARNRDKIISLCRRCFCCRIKHLIRVRRVENTLRRRHVMMMREMTMMTTTTKMKMRMIKTTRMMKMMMMTMSKTTKRKWHVEKNLTKFTKKIEMFSKEKRSTSRLILSRSAIKMTSMWNRKKAKKTLMKRKFHQAIRSIRQANLLVLRKKSIRSLRFSVASFQNLRSIRNFRSIFDEVRVVHSWHRSKKKNDRFLTKKTSNCRSNVVVVA